jgi:Outer membrane protein beta-barrel domain
MFRRRTLVPAFVLSVAASTAALAQKTEAHFGVLAGAAFGKVSGSDVTGDTKIRTGIAAGGFVNIGFSKNFSIEPEALFVQKGAKNTQSGVEIKVKISYVEIPVLLKVGFPPKSGTVAPHIYAGPYVGFKVGCHFSASQGSISASGDCEDQPLDTKIKSTDFGATFGGGVDVGRAIIDVRYDLGFTKIGDPSEPDVKTRTLYLLAGWTFRAPH